MGEKFKTMGESSGNLRAIEQWDFLDKNTLGGFGLSWFEEFRCCLLKKLGVNLESGVENECHNGFPLGLG